MEATNKLQSETMRLKEVDILLAKHATVNRINMNARDVKRLRVVERPHEKAKDNNKMLHKRAPAAYLTLGND